MRAHGVPKADLVTRASPPRTSLNNTRPTLHHPPHPLHAPGPTTLTSLSLPACQARPLAAALEVDLFLLFRPLSPSEKLLNTFTRTATKLLENHAAMKSKDVRAAVADVLGSVAVRYKKPDTVTTSLLHALYGFDHTVNPVAEVVERSYACARDHTLVARVLMEVCVLRPTWHRLSSTRGDRLLLAARRLSQHRTQTLFLCSLLRYLLQTPFPSAPPPGTHPPTRRSAGRIPPSTLACRSPTPRR